ncbi:hypothetical protein NE237_013141 [Protea cynaroides]|uniref:Uncharacterized protein n=1 Tax=Protea cynaroides TaxID=273540 RepID=A0A9Q0JZW0_9MAGN|nr:hypothetical protein NE237_013141 [Protea cynaroides]
MFHMDSTEMEVSRVTKPVQIERRCERELASRRVKELSTTAIPMSSEEIQARDSSSIMAKLPFVSRISRMVLQGVEMLQPNPSMVALEVKHAISHVGSLRSVIRGLLTSRNGSMVSPEGVSNHLDQMLSHVKEVYVPAIGEVPYMVTRDLGNNMGIPCMETKDPAGSQRFQRPTMAVGIVVTEEQGGFFYDSLFGELQVLVATLRPLAEGAVVGWKKVTVERRGEDL